MDDTDVSNTLPALAAGSAAVITGAASGIGLAAAKRLAGLGMKVVLADLGGLSPRVVRAERVARSVPVGDGHGGEPDRTAWDALVRVERA